ncbi:MULTISPECIES: RraA family protein [unclassified Sphingomonas]|jgi:regulator of RNase E activity RraA|uniref:RraA family protein n=1 Tax=unclassified Sphingomonas TaxID=196159 RepID=UPI000830D4F1|nr:MULTISPECIES: RraA family protein [unclassified Sphingomonas]MCH4893698.1 RraA family protein [Sphingomonas sp. SFZ2018-12]
MSEQLRREAAMMDIDALIEQREGVSADPLSVDQTELLARYEKLYTGLVSDVLREMLMLDQALPGALIPLRPEKTVAGIAFTVKSAPNVKITGEMETRTEMLSALTPDAFILWDSSGDERATLWGGVMTATASGLGVRAACVDGGIRDTHQVLQKDFPVFYRYRSPNGSLGRCQITHYQIPIKIGDVLIKPGDVVLGDIDGVVVVPRAQAVAVLERSEALRRSEEQIFDWVENGDSVEQITARGGYF